MSILPFPLASPDPRIWKLGPLTLDPQAWQRFRCALGHHLLRQKASPYNEEAAEKLSVYFAVRVLLHKVEHPTLPVDLILRGYYTTRTCGRNQKHEFGQIPGRWWNHKPHDPGNRPKVYKALEWSVPHIMIHEIQPAAWQMSLMQPIYKVGDKFKADPASYRGIYLSSA